MAVLRGAKAPLLQKMIVDELSKEKLVLEHGGERKAVRKTLFIQHMISNRVNAWLYFKENFNAQYDLFKRVFALQDQTEIRLYRFSH